MFVLFVMSKKVRHQQVITLYNVWKPLLFFAAIAVAIVYLGKAFGENIVWFIIASALIAVIALLAHCTKHSDSESTDNEPIEEESNSS